MSKKLMFASLLFLACVSWIYCDSFARNSATEVVTAVPVVAVVEKTATGNPFVVAVRKAPDHLVDGESKCNQAPESIKERLIQAGFDGDGCLVPITVQGD